MIALILFDTKSFLKKTFTFVRISEIVLKTISLSGFGTCLNNQ